MSEWLPNTRLVLGAERKYLLLWAAMNVAHFLAMPLVAVALVEFSSLATRRVVAAWRWLR